MITDDTKCNNSIVKTEISCLLIQICLHSRNSRKSTVQKLNNTQYASKYIIRMIIEFVRVRCKSLVNKKKSKQFGHLFIGRGTLQVNLNMSSHYVITIINICGGAEIGSDSVGLDFSSVELHAYQCLLLARMR